MAATYSDAAFDEDTTAQSPDSDEAEPSTVHADIMDGVLESEAEGDTHPFYGGMTADLVTQKYAPLSARLTPSDLPVHARIVLPAHSVGGTARVSSGIFDEETYETAITGLAGDFPLRVARLRDLFRRVEQARLNYEQTQQQAEQERENINLYNNAINGKVEKEAADIRAKLQAAVENRHASIREAKEIIGTREAEIGKEINAAQTAYWEIRQARSKIRDEAAHLQNEAARKKAEEAEEGAKAEAEAKQTEDAETRRQNKAKQEARDIARLAALQTAWEDDRARAKTARDAALSAQTEAYAAEQTALNRLQNQTNAQHDAHRDALQNAGEKAEAHQSDHEQRAGDILRECDALCDTRHNALQAALVEARTEQKRREDEAKHALQTFAEAAAYAHLLPGEATLTITPDELQKALLAKQFEEASASEVAATRHITDEPEAKSKSGLFGELGKFAAALFEKAALFAATLACGGIFGLSLGLVTKVVSSLLFRGTDEEKAKQLVPLLIMAGLGTALFYLMGRVTEYAAGYASEELNADAEKDERGTQTSKRGIWAAIACGSVAAVLASVEIVVEKSGVVQAIASQDKNSVVPGGVQTNPNELKYWMLAAMLSVPFIAFHAFHGAHRTRRRLANRRRKEAFSAKQEASLTLPEVQAVSAAAQIARDAQAHFANFDIETSAVSDARRLLDEARAQKNAQQDFIKTADWNAQKEHWIQGDALVRQAELAREALLIQAQSDPKVQAAKTHAEAL